MRNVDKLKLVIGLVVLFAGLDIAILLSHTSRFIGIMFIIIGIGILATTVEGTEKPRKRREKHEEKKPQNIAAKIIDLLTLRERIKPLLLIFGIGIILLVGFYNIFISKSEYLGSNDYVALILAGVLVIYNFIPRKYYTERDFAFLFSILLFVFLVIPTTLLSLTSGQGDTNSPITYYLLSLPTVGLVSLFGIPAVTPGLGLGYPAYHVIDLTATDGSTISLGISLSCSGLYSVAIFVSAFVAFIAIEYQRFDRQVIGLLGLGILLAWLANIIRMSIIVIVGRYYGSDTMVWVHNNIGEIIFMIWVIAFWLVMFWFLGPRAAPRKRKAETKCPGCGDELSPALASVRCECGTISHAHCLETNDNRCFRCGMEIKL
jgi:archaeosortase C (PEF-CTERM variant)